MPTGLFQDPVASDAASDERRRVDIDHWFRELDQRRICHGRQEWLVEVTSILCQEEVLWIQMADRARRPGSVLLCVRPSTSVEQAVMALSAPSVDAVAYPRVVCLPAGPDPTLLLPWAQ